MMVSVDHVLVVTSKLFIVKVNTDPSCTARHNIILFPETNNAKFDKYILQKLEDRINNIEEYIEEQESRFRKAKKILEEQPENKDNIIIEGGEEIEFITNEEFKNKLKPENNYNSFEV